MEEGTQLAKLLNEFQDVFAKTEFDLGHFSEIEHSIDTGQSRTIKQRMRRTPACFAGEEEAYFKKMLEAGVIKESTSEWASAPVLFRKRDGSVRWCDKTFSDHLVNLADALSRFREHGLKLKPKKCLFFQKKVEFLGRRVSSNCIAMSDVDIQSVRNWPKPQCSKDEERFAGLANYHRGFVKDFSRLAAPLYQVVGKYKFQWGSEQDGAFTALKDALTRPPVLALPINVMHLFLILTRQTLL